MRIKTKNFPLSLSLKQGFTFAELLIAAFLTALLSSAVIAGLTGMLQFNQQAESKITRQQELSRSLGFIGDEVQRSSTIELDADTNLATLAPTFNTTNKTPILTLQIPGVSQRVIYYLATQSGTNWWGPRVLFRWGPSLDNNGLYTNATTPANWQYDALVDLIDDRLPNPNNACPTGWTANPTVTDRLGAYSCVASNGKLTNIVLRGQILNTSRAVDSVFEVAGQFNSRSSQ